MLDQVDELVASGWCLFSTFTGEIAPGQIHESAAKAHTALALMGDGAPYAVGPIFTRDAIAALERCRACDGNGVCQMCEASGSPCECAGGGCLVCGGDGKKPHPAADTPGLRAAAQTWLFLWDAREAKVVKAVPPNPPTTEQRAMEAIRDALAQAPEPAPGAGSGYFCVEGHEVPENTSYCAMCQTGVLSMTREAWERTANTYLEHFEKKHPRPSDGICERCVEIARDASLAARERRGAAYAGPESEGFWNRVNAVKGTYGEAVYAEACKLQEAEGRVLKILADEDEARGGPPPAVADDPKLRARLEAMFARIDDFRERMRRQTELPPASDPFWTTPLGQSVRGDA